MDSGPCLLGCALWVGAWLCGRAPADDTLEALARFVPDAPGAPALEGLRALGADRSWLLLPRPGRTVGWPRDAAGVPEPALLLCRGDVIVGMLRIRQAGWLLEPVAAASAAPLAALALNPRAGARALSTALAAGAGELERLDLARPAQRQADRRWQEALHPHPVGLEPAALQALTRVALVLDALELALGEQGAAVTAGEARARARALTEVRDAVEEVACGLVGGQYGLPGTVGP